MAARYNLDVPHCAHVGYYLFEQGRAQLEKSIGYQPRGLEGLRRGMVRHPTLVYLGGIGLLTGLIIAGSVAYARAAGGALLWQVAAALLALIPALTVAISLVNGAVTPSARASHSAQARLSRMASHLPAGPWSSCPA